MANRHIPTWLAANEHLEHLAARAIEQLQALPEQALAFEIAATFLVRSHRNLRAINALVRLALWEQAQVLARVAFETAVSFEYFILMCADDVEKAAQTVVDADTLARIKRYEKPKLTEAQRSELDAQGRELATRYDEKTISRLRKNGFSGLSVEQRAAKTNDADTYQVMYRHFSNNVHATDLYEAANLLRPVATPERILHDENRNFVTLETAHSSSRRILRSMCSIAGLKLLVELEAIAPWHKTLQET